MTDEAIPNHANLVGKALYLEFRKGVNTAQIILTPEGIDNTGKYVPVSTWRRQISSWSPKKPWRCYATANTDVVSFRKEMCVGEIHEMDTPELALSLAHKTIVDLTTLLNNLYNSDWELVEKPLAIEFSLEDLIDTVSWNTPQALIRRIGRARKEANFPEELITEIVE